MGYSRAGAVPVHLDRRIHVVRWIRVAKLISGLRTRGFRGINPKEVYAMQQLEASRGSAPQGLPLVAARGHLGS